MKRILVYAGMLGLLGADGCKSRDLPGDMVGSYTRSGDVPSSLRAELSIARGGIVLTVARASASVDLGFFASLFTEKEKATVKAGAKAGVAADLGRNVVSARAFRSLKCDVTACAFELAAEDGLAACSGSFERVKGTLVVVATGACQAYSGRWTALETGAPAASAPAVPMSASDGGVPVAPGAGLSFPPDIPAPHDHMSCLEACSIVDTRRRRETFARSPDPRPRAGEDAGGDRQERGRSVDALRGDHPRGATPRAGPRRRGDCRHRRYRPERPRAFRRNRREEVGCGARKRPRLRSEPRN